MSVKTIYGGQYFKAADIPDEGIVGRITGVRVGKVGESDATEKIILSLSGVDEEYACNKTNALVLAETFGDNEDEWLGRSIRLTRGRTFYKGSMVECITAAAAENKDGTPF